VSAHAMAAAIDEGRSRQAVRTTGA